MPLQGGSRTLGGSNSSCSGMAISGGDSNRPHAAYPTSKFLDPVAEEEFPAALGAADVLSGQRTSRRRPDVGAEQADLLFQAGKPILAATDPVDSPPGRSRLGSGRTGACRPAGPVAREAIRLGTDRELAGNSARRAGVTATVLSAGGGTRPLRAVDHRSRRHRAARVGGRLTSRSVHSSPESPARTVPIWRSCCSTRATRCTASSGGLHVQHAADRPPLRRPARP